MIESGEKISVIVPIYNVEAYLRRCIDSILSQSYRNLQIILVDDGSTDGCPQICDDYAKKDQRVKVIHKQNGGLSDARNCGIDIAIGKYVTFVDSDDYIPKDYIQFLFNMLAEVDADISGCSFRKFEDESTIEKEIPKVEKYFVFNREEAIVNLCYQRNIAISACGKLYKKELFNTIRFPKGRVYEDLGTTYKLFLLSSKMIFSPVEKYYYFQRHNSIMHTKFSLKNMDRIVLAERLYEDVKDISDNVKKAAISRMFIANIQVLREIPLDEKKYENEINIIKTNIKKYRLQVMGDKNVKLVNRIIAFSTYLGLRCVQRLGDLYKAVYRD